jgi:Fe-S cluster assembly iron-binding protein IscA
MLTVTDAAAERLAQMLDEAQASEGLAARFVVDGNDISMLGGRPEPGDATFECEGRVVLVIDAQTASALDGCTVDVSDEGSGVSLLPPSG